MDKTKAIPHVDAQVIIASVNALGRKNSSRIERYSLQDVDCIIIDEVLLHN
jgi:superfamily II DNA or RNA helicase